jgi:hypothetical protein
VTADIIAPTLAKTAQEWASHFRRDAAEIKILYGGGPATSLHSSQCVIGQTGGVNRGDLAFRIPCVVAIPRSRKNGET